MTSCWKGTDCSQERAILLLQSKFHKIRLVNFMPLYESRLSVSIASFIVIICLFATESLMSRCSLERIMRSDQLEPAESFGNRGGLLLTGRSVECFGGEWKFLHWGTTTSNGFVRGMLVPSVEQTSREISWRCGCVGSCLMIWFKRNLSIRPHSSVDKRLTPAMDKIAMLWLSQRTCHRDSTRYRRLARKQSYL